MIKIMNIFKDSKKKLNFKLIQSNKRKFKNLNLMMLENTMMIIRIFNNKL